MNLGHLNVTLLFLPPWVRDKDGFDISASDIAANEINRSHIVKCWYITI